MKILANAGNWYKGNTHMHTTMSDGRLEPEEAIELYRRAGYDFVALTDHRYRNEPQERGDFVVLSGAEYDTIVWGGLRDSSSTDYGNGSSADGSTERSDGAAQGTAEVFHIVGIGMKEEPEIVYGYGRYARFPKPQEIVDAILRAGGEAILAHPSWSVMNPDDLYALKGLAGVEIYNTVSEMPKNPDRADSSNYVDIWAKHGRLMNCFAADDAHGYDGDETRSFIRVNAPELTADALMAAIARGDFYASQGPEFYDIDLENGIVTAVVSGDVRRAVFATNTPWSNESVAELPGSGGAQIVKFHMQDTDTFVRILLLDGNGRRAWCSPFAVR